MGAIDEIDFSDEFDDEPEILTGCKLIRTTDKGYLVQHRKKLSWFPKSHSEWLTDTDFCYESWLVPKWTKLKGE